MFTSTTTPILYRRVGLLTISKIVLLRITFFTNVVNIQNNYHTHFRIACIQSSDLPSLRYKQYLSSGDCRKDQREDCQNGSVLYSVLQSYNDILCAVISTVIWAFFVRDSWTRACCYWLKFLCVCVLTGQFVYLWVSIFVYFLFVVMSLIPNSNQLPDKIRSRSDLCVEWDVTLHSAND